MLAEFSIVPLGEQGHFSKVVSEVLRLVDESGLPYELHAMGTLVEGDWDEVMGLIGRCHAHVRQHYPRVSTSIKIDDAVGKTGRLQGKVASVEALMGKRLERHSPPSKG